MSILPDKRSLPAPISRNLELEAHLEAVRWPNATLQTVLNLVGQLLTARRDQAGWDTFREPPASRPEQPLFAALAGFFQARLVAQQPARERAAWLSDAIARLNGAVEQAPGLTTYFRGLALAALPPEMGLATVAIGDLEWMRTQRALFPPGFQRSVEHALARAYAAAGNGAAAEQALARAGGAAAAKARS